jgi:hypothetical protein
VIRVCMRTRGGWERKIGGPAGKGKGEEVVEEWSSEVVK